MRNLHFISLLPVSSHPIPSHPIPARPISCHVISFQLICWLGLDSQENPTEDDSSFALKAARVNYNLNRRTHTEKQRRRVNSNRLTDFNQQTKGSLYIAPMRLLAVAGLYANGARSLAQTQTR